MWMCLFTLGPVGLILGGYLCVLLLARYTNRPVSHVWAEICYETFYNTVGLSAMAEDILMKNKNKVDLMEKSGKVAVITGGTRGIGTEVIKMLLQCDMNVIMGCRNVEAGERVLKLIRSDGIESGQLTVHPLDTSSLKSVRQFAKTVRSRCSQLNYLINNAGIMYAPFKESEDGYENHLATNYLGHFLLTHLLLDLLRKGGSDEENARIVNVASCAYLRGSIDFHDINKKKLYIRFEAYAQSKLAQVYFTTYLNKLLQDDNSKVQVHAVHPGIVNTELFDETIFKKFFGWFMTFFKTPKQGAYPIIYAAISPALEGLGGNYISNCSVQELTAAAKDRKVEKKLFDFTNDLLEIKTFGKI